MEHRKLTVSIAAAKYISINAATVSFKSELDRFFYIKRRTQNSAEVFILWEKMFCFTPN